MKKFYLVLVISLLYTHSNIVLFVYIHFMQLIKFIIIFVSFCWDTGLPSCYWATILFWNLILLSLMWNLASTYILSYRTSQIFEGIFPVSTVTYYRIYMAWLFKNLHMTWCLVYFILPFTLFGIHAKSLHCHYSTLHKDWTQFLKAVSH